MPDWFDGMIYEEGQEVTNPYSGQSYELTAMELSIYDFIMGSQAAFDFGFQDEEIIRSFQKALTWFRKNNPEAYYVLLD
tara:strand:+ start:257 stop:493 length:237 start_codon:yes stop_codon:yes gene_type:complete